MSAWSTAVGSGDFVAFRAGLGVGSVGTAASSVVTYTVGAVSAAHSTVSPATASITADGSSTQVITVQARDVNDNNLTTGGSTVGSEERRGGKEGRSRGAPYH